MNNDLELEKEVDSLNPLSHEARDLIERRTVSTYGDRRIIVQR